jgi:transposase InsO family protein
MVSERFFNPFQGDPMTKPSLPPTGPLWARFRFSVVGPLLSCPPARGELQDALQDLAAKIWTHPVTGRDTCFASGTIERWYYTARHEKDDPVRALQRAVRKDCGRVSLSPTLTEYLATQYQEHPHWTYQLHYDNVIAWAEAEPARGPVRSYSTVRRYMKSRGMLRKPRPRPKATRGQVAALYRRETREIRSYEAEYVGALWHLDFHHGSLKVLTTLGEWLHPLALAILDDHSRLCCHAQWYLTETGEDLVHGFSQALQKRGLPRGLMTDGGAAMIAEEFTEGLARLGIVHEKTLPYSPYQNGKQEAFWGTLEGRLMEMLAGRADLTLDFLNEATQAWVEIEYHRAVHREIGCSPVERFARAPDVLRASPSSNALRDAFRLEVQRRQRTSDGTISLEGMRFEVPSRYRHFRDLTVRYARWDLGRVDLVDPGHPPAGRGTILAPLYPLDRRANADGRRSLLEPAVPQGAPPASAAGHPPAGGESASARSDQALPPLLQKILDEYRAAGIPPAYLPKNPPIHQEPGENP